VVIKIEQSNSSAHGFDQITIRRETAELPPTDPSGVGYIRKYGLRSCTGVNPCGMKELSDPGGCYRTEKVPSLPTGRWQGRSLNSRAQATLANAAHGFAPPGIALLFAPSSASFKF